MIPPIVITIINVLAMVVAFSRTIYNITPQWGKFVGGAYFSFWVLAHLYPFFKGLMGRKKKTPTNVFVWSGLIAITLSLLWVAINPNSGPTDANRFGSCNFFNFFWALKWSVLFFHRMLVRHC
ncbi:putative 1,4-beta-D-xylan synthase [Helianthus anomalus]